MTMRAIIVFTSIAAASLGISCKTTWTSFYVDHCASQSGDDWCAAEYPDGSRPFCSRGISGCEEEMDRVSDARDGCVPSQPAEEVCYSPCGGNVDITEDATCLDGVSSTSEGESSSGTTMESSGSESGSESSSTTGPMPCVSDDECTDPDVPFCGVSGECGTCDGTADPDGACAEVDPLRPLCVNQECVACTPENPLVCDEQLLLCDGGSNACVPCTEHGQCGSGACELAVGTCFPPGTVVHVDGDGGQDFMTVAAAVMSIGAGLHGVIVVHEQNSGLGYPSVLIDGGKTIALLVAPGEAPTLQGTAGNPGLTVQGAGTVLYVDGLQVSQGTALGLRANGASAWVDRSRIVQNSGGGIVAENGADLTLRNCFVGGSLDDAIALEVNGASADVLYSTLGSGTFNAAALACTAPVAVDVRNSILVTRGGTPPDEVGCAAANITYTATEGAVPGTGNVAAGMFPGGTPGDWFVDYATGNFHLQNAGLTLFADIAQWSSSDPFTDIDGDPRPAIDGTSDYAGADVP